MILLAHVESPLSGALLAVAIGVIIGLGIAAVMSGRMHRNDHYRLRLLRHAMDRAETTMRQGLDPDHVAGCRSACRAALYRLHVALDDDDRIRLRGR